ncbi:MAG: 4Fe-4S dicluster domain-containing protein [Victivallales bacterium]|nr:4Fe-4S dicluster domain-containing protein [Victivallales bacterium]MCF7888860.1 4Fe-4S dicluster domain-containing protein [Victivallales bacterium]
MAENTDKNKLDPMLKYKVAEKPGGETVKACYSCGVCTAACPVNEVNEDFNPRKMIRMILLGDKENLFSSDLMWYCMLCERCYANCPQKVNFAHIARALRDIAVEEGFVDSEFSVIIKKIESRVGDLRKDAIAEVLKNKKNIENIDINKTLKELINSDE